MEHDGTGNSSGSNTNKPDEELLIERALMESLIEFGSAVGLEEVESAADLAARRQRHRDTMTRYRRRKKASVAEMKVEEQVLVAQLQSMLTLHASQSKSYCHGDVDDNDQQQQLQQRTPMDAFVELLTESESLHFENLLIKQRLADSYKFEKTLRHETELELLSHRVDDTVTRSSYDDLQASSSPNTSSPGRWITFVENEQPFFYVPFTLEECEARVAESRRKLDIFTSSIDRANLQFRNLLDWNVSTALEWSEVAQTTFLRFIYRKTFRNRFSTLEAFVESDWRIMHDARIYDATHSDPRGFQVLQSFGDNLNIAMWSSPLQDNSIRNRVLSVNARGPHTDHQGKLGFRTTNMSVQPKILMDMKSAPPQVTSKGEPVRYASEMIMQIVVTNGERDGDVDVEWCGRSPVLDEEHGRFLTVELGNILIRMETLVLSKRILPSSEGP